MRKKPLVILMTTVGALLLFAGPAAAQDVIDVHTETTVTFYLLCIVLVFLMHPGFAMLEAGLTGARNASNIMMKNLLVLALGFVVYWLVGAGISYGTSVGGLFGSDGFLAYTASSIGDADAFAATDFMFAAVFAATAATIVSGAVAGRMHLGGFVILATVLIGFIYPVVVHWQWGGGWLGELGMIDFAGSTVVHLTGGVAALTAAAILGPRPGKFDAHGKPRFMPGHSMPLAILGVFMLFFGWFGFNGGSILPGPDEVDAGLFLAVGPIILSTAMAASAGALSAVLYSAIRAGGKTDVSMAGNGLLAGLVGITAGPDVIAPIGALVIGIIAGIVVSIAVPMIERMGIDDAVGAFSVHGVCGLLGTVAVAFWHTESGLFYGSAELLVPQIVGPLAVAVFVSVVTAAVCLGLKAAGLLRVTDEVFEEGLDIHEHGVAAYNDAVLVGVLTTDS
ncbi:MAG TPA: ammonium transporter [Euzebya sp.]|nr:ammonium transporter [Euzebya sp.]